ncbi:MAG: hypothetical protein WA814_13100 [Candidatus Baltobacteraceae bacterium]
MRQTRSSDSPTVAVLGYAGDRGGNGLAYARLRLASKERLLRLPFRMTRTASSSDRAIDYAALTAVARALHERGHRKVRFVLGDEQFVEEIATRREIPETLVLPYVRLRCALNALKSFSVQTGATDELTQRARAEVALNLAA